MAWAVSVLGTEHRVQLGGDGRSAQHQPIAVIGPGTGFGVALLLRNRQGQCHVLATEGGHASLAAVDARELAVHRWLLQQGIFPSREHLLSGRGLERIYRALAGIDQIAVDDLPAHRIQQRAVAGDDALATEALALFCAMLGTAAADQALSCGARGGVYITGGIVRRFIPFLQQSRFRQHFDGQRPMHHYLKPIPVYVVNASHQGLVGAALASQSKRPTAPV
jgi:glucokinase